MYNFSLLDAVHIQKNQTENLQRKLNSIYLPIQKFIIERKNDRKLNSVSVFAF